MSENKKRSRGILEKAILDLTNPENKLPSRETRRKIAEKLNLASEKKKAG